MSQTTGTPGSIAAGWYGDPSGMPAQRWWDGSAWTDHVQPTPAAPEVPVAQMAYAPQTPQPAYATPAPQPTYAPQAPQPTYATQAPQPAYATPAPQASYTTAAPAYPAPASTPQPAPVSGRYNPYNSSADLAQGKNTPARNALILGIISLVVNPLCLPAIVAIVWGIVGIKRAGVFTTAGFGPVGKGKAIAGLVLGSVGLIATILIKGFMF